MNENQTLLDQLNEIVQQHRLADTVDLFVHTGGQVPFTCRDIPAPEAWATMNAFEKYARGVAGSVDLVTVDVVSTNGERTVIPFSRVVMLRASGDRQARR